MFKLSTIAGCVLLFCGLIIVYRSFQFMQHRWTVLEEPVNITEGVLITYDFTVDTEAIYDVNVLFNDATLDDALRSTFLRELSANVQVIRNGKIISDTNRYKDLGPAYGKVTKSLGPASSDNSSGRVIAAFRAKPGLPYRVDLRFTRSLPEFDRSDPLLTIGVENGFYTDAVIGATVLKVLGILVGIAGILCIVVDLHKG